MSATHPAIPVNIITGALGAGKTTVIARLLASKPAHESWLVILNEFTDTGIDTLTLAAAARGAYDVRMIPGGCLCCTGEEDFRRQLSGLLALSPAHWPARILIEPTGIGHPGAIIEELRTFERSGAVRLCSTIALLDAQRGIESYGDAVIQAQVAAADVLLLSKSELQSEAVHAAFLHWAATLFPAKRLVARMERGELPALALEPPPARFSFELAARPAPHQAARHALVRAEASTHEHADQAVQQMRQLRVADQWATAQIVQWLGREACGWRMPGAVLLKHQQLEQLLRSNDSLWTGVERFKAIVRTNVDEWQLVQRWAGQQSMRAGMWAQESRIEVQMAPGVPGQWPQWDAFWQANAERSPVG